MTRFLDRRALSLLLFGWTAAYLAPLHGMHLEGREPDIYMVVLDDHYSLGEHWRTTGLNLTRESEFKHLDQLDIYITTANATTLSAIRADRGVVSVEASHIGVDPHVRDFRAINKTSKGSRLFKRRNSWATMVQPRATWNTRIVEAEGKLDPSPAHDLVGDYKFWSGAGYGVKVYIMDSGIDIGAPEFGGRAENFKGLKMNQESPYAPQGRVSEKEGMDDFNGHGTFVAGIAGANYFGVAPEASLYNVKVGLRTGIYSLTGRVKAFNDIIEAHTESMRTSLDNYGYRGAIINMSWGIFTHYETVVIGRALTRCAEAGIFLVAAAGNSNVQVALYPCTHHNVHCVGSINAFYEKAPMSNWGRRVIWWAPGDDVVSILPRRKRAPDPQGNIINYAVASGTSFAAPHFAGVASIILAWRGFMPWIEVGKIAIDNALRDVLVNFKNTNFLVNTGILNPKKDDREPFMYAGWKYADVRNGDRFFPERISTTPKVRSSAQSHRVHSAPGNQPSHAVILPPRGQPPAGAATFEPTSSAGGRPPSTEARSESTLSRTPLQRRLPPPGTSDAGSTITLSNTFFTNTALLTTWTSSMSYRTASSEEGTKSTASKTKSTASGTRSTETDDPDCDPEETEL